MTDTWSKEKRSEVMSLVKSTGNKETEIRLIEIFRTYGIVGWRRNQKLPGRPDFLFRCERVAVFTDGCFWHGCPKCNRRPKSNRVFWNEKISKNRERDKAVGRVLRQRGWAVVRIWQHELANSERVVARLRKFIALR